MLGSFHDLAAGHAAAVVDALARHGVDAFVFDHGRQGYRLGVSLHDRPAALRALQGLSEPGWYVTSERGHRRRTDPLHSRAARRHMRRATAWRLHRAFAYGDVAVGRDQAAEVGFFAPGTSGQLELIGTRGQQRFQADSPRTTVRAGRHTLPGRAAFPLDHRLDRFDGDVDVVVTWVDGDDPDWRRERDRWSATAAPATAAPATPDAMVDGRFRQRDELRYVLRAVNDHLGWVRRVWLVTAGQRPAWLREDGRLTVVDHSEILDARHLPTFNSHVIESALHRIPGLAEHFVYLNDDVFIGHPLPPDAFFTAAGLVKVFDSDARVWSVEDDRTGSVDTAALRTREYLLNRYGKVAPFKQLHAPFPLTRSLMSDLEAELADDVERTRGHRFRTAGDLSLATSLAPAVAVASGRGVHAVIGHDYVNIESDRLPLHLARLHWTRGFDTFCLNETEQHDAHPEATAERLARFLTTYFPVASPWEHA